MDKDLELSREDFDFVAGQGGLYAYGRKFGPAPQACPHMQGSAFYQHIDTPEKEYWPVHQPHCVDQYSPLPIVAGPSQPDFTGASTSTSAEMMSIQPPPHLPQLQLQVPGGPTVDLNDALNEGIVNKNAMGKRAAYDQLTPALPALFGRHAPASQRLIWCNTKSNDNATKAAREHFTFFKSDWTYAMKYAHEKFISTRMRGAFVMNVDVPSDLSDFMIGSERFNWITFADAQMTLCVKLQEVIKAYDPSRAFVLVVYALSSDQLSAALWAWTYKDFARADPPLLLDLRTQIRQLMKDTKRGEKYMYQVQKDQNDP
ncbi:MYND finger protein [Ceratobasidium theobromae]|uniref:MYND finger protein n=1 Tax=Ceratobasidium theobromae TaxID=1582974 RepID=A0A5N5QK04_9AGAM|nr:MYND finger protein [Ceratobasidium theobromae]